MITRRNLQFLIGLLGALAAAARYLSGQDEKTILLVIAETGLLILALQLWTYPAH